MDKHKLLVSIIYLLTIYLETVFSFGASLFGNRFIFRNQRYVTKPSQAYRLRENYAQNYGPYGDNFIETVGKVPLYKKPRRPRFIHPCPGCLFPFAIAPFGTEGFTFTEEEERIRKKRKNQRELLRQQRGYAENVRPGPLLDS